MARSQGRTKLFRDPDEVTAKDYDPEPNGVGSGSESDIADSEAEDLGTEHYVSVGKSKLKQKENVSLGPEYRGSRISRAALEDNDEDEGDEDDTDADDGDDDRDGNESSDDPDTADLEADEADTSDSEIDSENAVRESDERYQKLAVRGSSKHSSINEKASRAKAVDIMCDEHLESDSDQDEDMDDGLEALVDGGQNDSGEDDSEGSEDLEEKEDEEFTEEEEEDDDDDEDDDDEEEEEEKESVRPSTSARPSLSALSNRADVDKGIAIQKQRKIYDGLLNLRIRLQKALVAANSFPTAEADANWESQPYEAAEEAAIKLLNTISSLRGNTGDTSSTGEKRKRELDASMSNQDIWERLQKEDTAAVDYREARLEKWSKKVQSVNLARPDDLGRESTSLIGALQEQLVAPNNRLVKRTRVVRSCAPAQLANKVTEDEYVFDDADFYQLLLKELVDQRTVEGDMGQAAAVPTVMMAAKREAKMRKQVDRKASKGRKMRFTVHEKLQNFMAPEDRRKWEQAAIDRFFGTLFGQKLELNEEDESGDDDLDEVDAEEEGLRLFRN